MTENGIAHMEEGKGKDSDSSHLISKIAVEGCCHGELDATYSQIQHLEKTNDYKVSLLIICGDFQAIRNKQDLQCMSVPDKYKKLGEFYK